MKKLFTFLFIFVNLELMSQQWTSYNPTAGFDINTVAVMVGGVIVVGGGHESNDSVQIMFRSDDYGQTWVENQHDGYAPWNKSIAFSGLVNGFGVGNNGRIIQSNDGGLNWGYATYPANRDFNKIVNVNARTYYIVGGNQMHDSIQTVVKTTDGGAHWQVIYDTPAPWLKSVYFTDTLTGVTVGDSGVILRTINGGNTWSQVTAPVNRDFNGITFVNADTGYVVGGNSNHRTIMRTNDAGLNWTVVLDTVGGILNDISFASAATGYAVGDSATVLKSTDGGANWIAQVVDTALNGSEQIRAVKFYDENFGAIAGRRGLLYVFLGSPFPFTTFHTEQVSNQTYTSAILNGKVRGLTVPINLFFEYDTNILFTHSIQATPAALSDTFMHSVTASVSSLLPYTVYYYRLKGISDSNTYYGHTLTFYTAPSLDPSDFITRPATYVTDSSATLKGEINNFQFNTPVQVSFQYGTTNALGREVSAGNLNLTTPSVYPIEAPVSGLSPDTLFYYYRLKVVAGFNTYFGNTRQVYKGVNEIPNWDFQNWETHTVVLPSHWYVSSDSFARVNGHSGNYALELKGTTLATYGSGIFFTARPDSFSLYMKYDIEASDTALILVSLFKNGQLLTPFLNLYKVEGSSNGGYEKLSYPISYNSSLVPDSITIIITSSNLILSNDTCFAHSNITIDDISFSPTVGNVANYNFENWFNYTVERPEGWKTESYFVDSANLPAAPMVSKLSRNTNGEYAVQIQSTEFGGFLNIGYMATCENFYKNTPDFPVTHKYMSLNGYYEYFPENGDSMYIGLQLKNGGRYGTVIGGCEYLFTQPQSSFSTFDILINYYTDSLKPDWATIEVNNPQISPRGYTKLILDKLSFDGFVAYDSVLMVGIGESPTSGFVNDEVKVYPNPSYNIIIIEFNNGQAENGLVQLMDPNGQIVKEISFTSELNLRLNLNVADLSAGFYFLRLKSGNRVFNKKVVVVR